MTLSPTYNGPLSQTYSQAPIMSLHQWKTIDVDYERQEHQQTHTDSLS